MLMSKRYQHLARRCVGTAGVILLAATALGPISAADAAVRIEGLEGVLLDNALVHVSLDEEPCDAPEWRIRELFSRIDEDVRAALEAYGYYSPAVTAELALEETCWDVLVTVDPGEPVRLRDVELRLAGDASDDEPFQRVIDEAMLEPGEPLVHAAYEQLKRRLQTLALQRGYPDAAYSTHRIDVYPESRVADITLVFDSGPRYTFGPIEFDQDVLDPTLLERYYEFRQGDPFNRLQLTRLHGVLTDSGYFNSVDIRPLAADRDAREIPIAVTLTPVRRRAINYGLGFSTDTGPRFRFGSLNRLVDRRGTQSSVNGQLSPVISEIAYNRRFPYGDPRTEWFSLDFGIKHEDTETAVSDTVEVGVRRVVARQRGWQETQFIDAIVEDFVVADIESRSRLLMPGISWLKVVADNSLRPRRGYRLGLELSAANDTLGSDATFAQAEASAKWITTFDNNTRLLLRLRLGFTWHSEFDVLPPSVRFFAGGDNSIRGFDFESLGPMDEDGQVIGGDRLAVASAEYEIPFSPSWSGAAFIDSGNAFTGTNFDGRTGAGFGLRWQSPLGPIRFDIAWPINDIEKDPRLHVSLGADL
jgi:translocation and assembly module TamA